MKASALSIPGLILFEPNVFNDTRGYFYESFNQRDYVETIGQSVHFVQDNQSHSVKHVLRGLHYQVKQTQGKLIRAVHGEIFAVAIDLRKQSLTFTQSVGIHLSSENKHQFWVPDGFAFGFLVLSEMADVLYKTTDYWSPEHERCIAWNDPTLAIQWPIDIDPILSEKDARALAFSDAEYFP